MTSQSDTDYEDYIHEPNAHDLGDIPGDYGVPFVGLSFIKFIKDPFVWARDNYKKHGCLFKTNLTGNRAVFALGPELVQQVMLDPNRDFSSKMGYADRVSRLFANSFIMEDFEHHRFQRRIMQTAFKNE